MNYSALDRALLQHFGFQLLLTGSSLAFSPYNFSGLVQRSSGLVLLSLWLIHGLSKGRSWLKNLADPLVWNFLLLFMFSGLSVWVSDSPSLGRDYVEGRAWILLLFLVSIDLKLHFGPTFSRFLVAQWADLLIVTVVYGFYQVFYALDELRAQVGLQSPTQASEQISSMFNSRLHSSEMFSVFLYPNLFACFCALSALLFTALWWRQRQHPGRLLPVAIALAGLAGAQSKGAWLCLGMSLLVLCGLHLYRISRKQALGYFLACCLGGGLLVFWMWPDLEASVFVRRGYWGTALQMFLAHPWTGVGINNFSEHYSAFMLPYASEVRQAHNDTLQTFCELGIVGGTLFVIYWGVTLRRTLSSTQASAGASPSTDAPGRPWGTLAWAVFLLGTCALRIGSMDINFASASAWLFILAAVAAIYLIKTDLQKNPFTIAPGLYVGCALYFLFHSFFDFPTYDHNLYGLFMVGLVGFVPLDAARQIHAGLRYTVILALSTLLLWAWTRHENLFPVALLEFKQNIVRRDIQELVERGRKHPGEHLIWDQLLRISEKVNNDPRLVSGPEYSESIRRLLACRPHSAGLLLKRALTERRAEEAETYHRRSLEEYPLNARYVYHYAEFLARHQRADEAGHYYRLAVDLHQLALRWAEHFSEIRMRCLDNPSYAKAIRFLEKGPESDRTR